ncbi:hypothetical protein BCR34DRAFT_574745 [Clohesyomyces aquaticus]|uniref:Uncharacterized protein n=1 Tax=Clohesyomyces aquaticus TaxID=1231657 RepID=A0A1Y1YU64_9PLEO|nr:hypothetical protein BCR34DRAFT_574745 [Clohesyomyces aquaticus]
MTCSTTPTILLATLSPQHQSLLLSTITRHVSQNTFLLAPSLKLLVKDLIKPCFEIFPSASNMSDERECSVLDHAAVAWWRRLRTAGLVGLDALVTNRVAFVDFRGFFGLDRHRCPSSFFAAVALQVHVHLHIVVQILTHILLHAPQNLLLNNSLPLLHLSILRSSLHPPSPPPVAQPF